MDLDIAAIAKALQERLPPEHHGDIPRIIRTISELAERAVAEGTPISEDALLDAGVPQALSGVRISFDGSQMGDVTFGDVIGGNKIELRVAINLSQHTTDDPVKAPRQTLRSRRSLAQKSAERLLMLKEQALRYGTEIPAEIRQEVEFEEQRIVVLRNEISKELREQYLRLPRAVRDFIGRGVYLERIIKLLNDAKLAPVIAIDGLGGVGKTTLARETLRQTLDNGTFYAGAWESAKPAEFTGVGIQPLFTAVVDFDNLLDSIGSQLGYFEVAAQRTTASKRQIVQTLLREESYLVVIDNLETVEGYQELVANLDGLFGRSKAIVTTRKKIADLRGVYSISLGGMEPDEAVQFMRTVALERGEGGELIYEADSATLEQVYTATGGLPLAMELVVGQAAFSSLGTVLNRLRSVNYQRVAEPESDTSVYNQFFKYIYWDAWNQLSMPAQDLLMSLGAFDLIDGAASDILDSISDLAPDELQSAIGELLKLSLIRRVVRQGKVMYFLHPLTHRFVQADLLEAEQ